jgi:DNA-binding SARP family transcriptional activator
MLSVGLLGVFRIAGVDNRTWSDLGPGGRGLASFLFTYPARLHRRERLADLFWPTLHPEHARRALNCAVYRLRKLLAVGGETAGTDSLQTVGTELALQHARWLDIDVRALRDAAAFVLEEPPTWLEGENLRNVTKVLHRYEGPFLDGDDGDWILEERERLHSLFLRTTTRVVCRLGAVGAYHEAISLARRALYFDPYREELVRNLLTLLALDERRGEAIRYFEHWSGALKKELDISPLPSTLSVLDEIRALNSTDGFRVLRTHLLINRGAGQESGRDLLTK